MLHADREGTSCADPATLTAEQAAREQVWLTLSDALDATDDPHGLLTRLALALGSQAGPERLTTLLAQIG